jgi:hypothetical protein
MRGRRASSLAASSAVRRRNPQAAPSERKYLPIRTERLGLSGEQGDVHPAPVRRRHGLAARPLHGHGLSGCHAADDVPDAVHPAPRPDRPVIQRAYPATASADPVATLISVPVLGLHLRTVAVPVHQDDRLVPELLD